MGAEIDRLEIAIETEANKASQQLQRLSKGLDKIAGKLSKIESNGLISLANGVEGLANAMQRINGAKSSDFTKLARNIEKIDSSKLTQVGNAMKYLSESVKSLEGKNISIRISDQNFKNATRTSRELSKTADELAEKFRDVGKVDLSGYGTENLGQLEKEADKLEKKFDYLLESEERMLALNEESPSGKAWEKLQYDISATANKLDAYKAKIADIKSIQMGNLDSVVTNAANQVTGNAPINSPESLKTSTVSYESLKYNAEAMRAVFGQGAEDINSWSEALQKFGVNAASVLNDMQDIPVSLDLSTYEGQIRKIKAELGEMRITGLGAGNEEYDNKYLELEKVLQKQKEYKRYMSELAKLSEWSAEAVKKEGASAGLTAEQMDKLAKKKSLASLSNKELEKTAQETSAKLAKEGRSGKGAAGIFGKFGKFANKAAGKTSGFFSKLSKGFGGVGSQSKKAGKGMNKQMSGFFSLGRMVGMSVLYSSVFRMITAINQGLAEGMQNLAQYSERTNQSISSLMSSMTQLKNSFATAFAPILDVVAPYLVTFINLISKAVTYVGMFFAALSGRTSFVKAIPVTEDFAAGLDKTAGSANDANEAAKELEKTLLGFDEINKLNDKSASGGSGGSGSGGYTPPSPSDMFEEVPIDSEILKWADKFKDALEKIKKTAEPTTAALKKLYDEGLRKLGNFSITALKDLWHNYLQPIGKWMLSDNSGLPRFFKITNDLLNEINWSKLNKSLADFFTMLQKPTKFVWNGLMDFYEYFLKPVAVWTMGEGIQQLVDALTDFGNKIHWEEINKSLRNFWQAIAPFAVSIGQGIVNFFKNLLSVGGDFINKVVPGGLNSLAEAIKKINPETAEKIGTAIGAIATAIKLFKGLEWFGKLFSAGGAIGKGFAFLASHPYFTIALGIAGIVIALDQFGVIDVDWDWLWGKLKQVKEIIQEFIEKVDWKALIQAIKDFAKAFAPFVEGFAEGFLDFFDFLLNDIGAPLLNTLSTILEAIADVIKKFDPDFLHDSGESLGFFVGVLITLKVAKSIAGKVKGLYDVIKGFIGLDQGFSNMSSGSGGIIGWIMELSRKV